MGLLNECYIAFPWPISRPQVHSLNSVTVLVNSGGLSLVIKYLSL